MSRAASNKEQGPGMTATVNNIPHTFSWRPARLQCTACRVHDSLLTPLPPSCPRPCPHRPPQTNNALSSGRRKRAIPEGTAAPEAIAAFTLKGSFPLHKTTQPGILALALHPTEVRPPWFGGCPGAGLPAGEQDLLRLCTLCRTPRALALASVHVVPVLHGHLFDACATTVAH